MTTDHTSPRANRRRKKAVAKVSLPDTPGGTAKVSRSGTWRRPAEVSHADTSAPPTRTTDAFRARMRVVGELIRDGFGLGADLETPRVNQDACRLTISLLIETLFLAEERLSTDELAAVSKIVAEQRKIDAPRRDSRGANGTAQVSSRDTSNPAASRPLPGSFDRIVDRIYGTNLAGRDADSDDVRADGVADD